MSSTVKVSVAVPAVAAAVPKLAVQVIAVVPQPEVIVTPAMSLVLGTTISGAVPVKVNVTGAIAPLTATLWVPPPVMAIVGAGGALMVIVALLDDIWP